MDEAVKFTERIMADHKNILVEKDNMDYLVHYLKYGPGNLKYALGTE